MSVDPGDSMGMPLPWLLDPDSYDPNTFDYTLPADAAERKGMPSYQEWISVFRKSIPSFTKHGRADSAIPDEQEREKRVTEFETHYRSLLDMLDADPNIDRPDVGKVGQLNCVMMVEMRDAVMRQAGLGDIFLDVKSQENSKALEMLPSVLEEVDAVRCSGERLQLLLRGALAGNIFDLGAAASSQAFEEGETAFNACRAKLLPRPWAIDDMDLLLQRFRGPPHRKAVVFVDNAGSDVVLGMVPLARELLRRGTDVVLAANSAPNINDITAAELTDVMVHAVEMDVVLKEAWQRQRLQVVASGSTSCVMDLRRLSPELAAEAQAADLVVLEGMGRAIETNLDAKLAVDVLKIGMIKHPEVAVCLGSKLYDCVCRFEPAVPEFLDSYVPADPAVRVLWPPISQMAVASDEAGGALTLRGADDRDALGEGPVWDGSRGVLYWVDIVGRTIHAHRPHTGFHCRWQLPELVGCVALAGARPEEAAGQLHRLVAAVCGRVVALTLQEPEVNPEGLQGGVRNNLLGRVVGEELLTELGMPEGVVPNDGKPDRSGRLWMGTCELPPISAARYIPDADAASCDAVAGALRLDPAGPPPRGQLYRIQTSDATGIGVECSVVEAVGRVGVSNGLDWTGDGATFLYVDSRTKCVHAYDWDETAGQVAGRRVACALAAHGLPGVPDGMTLDEQDMLWIALWNGGEIVRMSPEDGRLDRRLPLPMTRPTSCAFGGPLMSSLFITSCRRDKGEAADLPSQSLAGAVLVLDDAGSRGRPANRCKLL